MTIMQKVMKTYQEKGLLGVFIGVMMRISLIRRLKHKYIEHYLRKHYDYVIERYKSFNALPPPYAELLI